MDTPLEFFLISSKGHGAYFKALIDFLASKQNDFLNHYKQVPGSKVKTAPLLTLKERDVINYDPGRDLLTLFLANRNYSFDIGKAEKLPYDFKRIEKLFVEKLCFGKPSIQIQVNEFIYRDDILETKQLINLNLVTPQVNFITHLGKYDTSWEGNFTGTVCPLKSRPKNIRNSSIFFSFFLSFY